MFVPKLIPGLEITPFDSSSPDAMYLLRHPNGTRWEISELLRRIILAVDGRSGVDEIAENVTLASRYTGEEAQVREAILGFLTDARIVERENESFETHGELYTAPAVKPKTALLLRIPLLSPRFLQPITGVLQWLFWKPLAVPLVPALVLIQIAWLARYAVTAPAALQFHSASGVAGITAALYFSYFFHEFGHASACRRFGCEHGGIGFGLYMVFPRLYADVSDTWKLPRLERAVVDCGGIYFQGLFATVLMAVHFSTGNSYCLLAAIAIDLACLHNLSPFIKLDGYWLLSDLLGVTNLTQKTSELVRFRSPSSLGFSRGTAAFIWAYFAMSVAFISFIVVLFARRLPDLVRQYPGNGIRLWASILQARATGDYGSAFGPLVRISFQTMIIFGAVMLLKRILSRTAGVVSVFFRKLQRAL